MIEKRPVKKVLISFFLLNILLLIIFKYTNFAIYNINNISTRLGGTLYLSASNLILPIGLSFYIFQSCTYLTDIYKKKIQAERNFFKYAAFVSFFPTILSGPIQKSRELLPQIKNPHAFDSDEAKKGTILFIWGLFEKILVANKLSGIVSTIYADYSSYDRIYYLIAAILFSLYIYADFSSYSDMARGISKIMGIYIKKNFDNPYLSTSTGEFWNRWHISLNEWLKENVYIPLGGNRKGKIRKYVNTLIVFLLSGLWHGAAWHFIAWGILNGIIVVTGQFLSPLKSTFYKKLKIDENCESIIFLKRISVFALISFTWIFFHNGVMDSVQIVTEIFHIKLVNLFTPEILSIAGTPVTTFMTFLVTFVFCWIQVKRQNEHYYFERFKSQPIFFQAFLLSVIIVLCVFSLFEPNAAVNTQFLYFQF